MTDSPWTLRMTPGIETRIKAAQLEAVREVFEEEILPEAKRTSPVSPTNPKIPGTKYRDTGLNRNSLDVEVKETAKGVQATLFGQSGYSGFLEVGTRLMPARPYLYPSFRKFVGNIFLRLREKLGGVS